MRTFHIDRAGAHHAGSIVSGEFSVRRMLSRLTKLEKIMRTLIVNGRKKVPAGTEG